MFIHIILSVTVLHPAREILFCLWLTFAPKGIQRTTLLIVEVVGALGHLALILQRH